MKRIISLLLIVLLAFTGCKMEQPVPTVQSDVDKLIEQAQTTPDPDIAEVRAEETPNNSPLYARLGAPAVFAPEIETNSDSVTIKVDAKVVLPDTDKLPIVKVKPAQFSQETVSNLFELLCGDTVMYDTSPSGFTRNEIIANTEVYKSWIENDFVGLADLKEEGKGMLALVEKELAQMPENIEELVSTGELREMVYSFYTPDLGRYMGVHAVEKPEAPIGESHGRTFKVQNDFITMDWDDHNVDYGPETKALIAYHDETDSRIIGDHKFELINSEENVPDEALKQLGMTPEEAAELVISEMKKAGLELAVDKVYLDTIREFSTVVIDGVEFQSEPTEDSQTNYAYAVTLGQVMGGAPTRTVTEAEGNNCKNVASMEPSWFYQHIECGVFDGKIMWFAWEAPMEEVEVMEADSALLPFEEIAAIFDVMLQMEYLGNTSDPDLLGIDVSIDRIELELQRITPDGSITEGLLVPVWNFYGNVGYKYTFGDHQLNDGMNLPRALLTINAIDGSVINIFEGY